MIFNSFKIYHSLKYNTFLLLILTISNASAVEYYDCQMKRFIFLENEEVLEMALDEFSFIVTQHLVQFGEGGFFDAADIPLIMNNKGWVHASDDLSVFILKDGLFYYSMVTHLNVRAIEGTCVAEEML